MTADEEVKMFMEKFKDKSDDELRHEMAHWNPNLGIYVPSYSAHRAASNVLANRKTKQREEAKLESRDQFNKSLLLSRRAFC